ncbi:Condensin complex subunit 2, putative isoform 2 [Hibiscus syriacus]|uniref:Condensin complex subunit 2 n=1 Tax=Hibiscus syriacus TaxID=106335 RepID=A0A6A2Z0N3_HIBSY|nr:Condensin complex subunit 2, putative isoform 2 [Hibiscus syriacus]
MDHQSCFRGILSELVPCKERHVWSSLEEASCTLEAGVKNSLRVDSVHSEAYKVLRGINRAGYENEQDSVMEDNNAATAQKGNPKKELEKKVFAFVVDPLYHQTSAQFDEGGAKGLLLNNLGVYAGCRVLFDSFEVPGREIPCSNQHDVSETIDLSFAEEYLERMPSIVNEEFNGVEPSFMSYHEDKEQFSFNNPDADDRFEEVDENFFFGLGFPLKQNAWAGPDHWKYRKTKGSKDVSNEENAATLTTKKTRNKKQTEPDIDFTKASDNEVPDIFAPPKNLKSLLLPSSRATCNTKLPEDCHYQPEDLVKLFLLPDLMCLGRRRSKLSGNSVMIMIHSHPGKSKVHLVVFMMKLIIAMLMTLACLFLSLDRLVKLKFSMTTSKQVDVQALKETLWDQILQSQETSSGPEALTALLLSPEETLSLKHLLASFPADCKAAATTREISPHLCFICLLHLANEHGLCIHGRPNMEDLAIQFPH